MSTHSDEHQSAQIDDEPIEPPIELSETDISDNESTDAIAQSDDSGADSPPVIAQAKPKSGLYKGNWTEEPIHADKFVDSIIRTPGLFHKGKLANLVLDSIIGEYDTKTVKEIIKQRIIEGSLDPANPSPAANGPVHLQSAHVAAAIESSMADPINHQQAMKSVNASQWSLAELDELKSIEKNQTWTLVKCPVDRHPIGCKWVYKTKYDEAGNFKQYKARIVAKGFAQKSGIDYTETFAPVARFTSIRALLAIGAHYDLEIHHMDVKTAFLNGEIDHEIYMAQPEGHVRPGEENLVCKLNKSLYGLKQAGRAWYEKIHNELIKLNFTRLETDNCIYISRSQGRTTVIALYVDDLLLLSNCMTDLVDIKRRLSDRFEMKDLSEVRFILGIKVERDRRTRTLWISSHKASTSRM
jgi:hypothetical protein